MADTKPQDATRLYQLTGDEAFFTTDDPDGTPVDRQVRTDDIASYSNHFRYTVSVTLSTNDLVVALKDLDGNTPSSTYPVRLRIGDAERTVSGALSVTAAAGTNWCNAGGSELATNSAGYFVYAGYNATDGVVIGFSRIAHATTYGDFSATSTNEQFCKINDITNAGGTDDYTVIGYFEATLSAGAGYTWTSPTNVISTPRYHTNWMDFTPSLTGFSSDPTNTVYVYMVDKKNVTVQFRQQTNGTSNATNFLATMPFTAMTLTNGIWAAGGLNAVDNGSSAATTPTITLSTGSNSATIYKDSDGSSWTGTNGKRIAYVELNYRIA